MIEDIVPITYINGSGGNFLCHFIVSAKRNNKNIIELSKHGNTHEFGLKDIPSPSFGILTADNLKINHILTQTPNILANTPYYTSAHIADPKLIHDNFKKSIRIVYDLDDVDELTLIHLGKYSVDCENINLESVHTQLPFIKFRIKKYNEFFKNNENYDSMLLVSWKEIYHSDPQILIDKLHKFTNIPKNNFSLEQMLIWRNATQMCIETVLNIVKDK